MADFSIVDLPSILNQVVNSYDSDGGQVPDDLAFQNHGAISGFLYAEFLFANGLLRSEIEISRREDLVILWSDLSDLGQDFTKVAYDKWLQSVSDIRISEMDMSRRLGRHWAKYSKSRKDGG